MGGVFSKRYEEDLDEELLAAIAIIRESGNRLDESKIWMEENRRKAIKDEEENRKVKAIEEEAWKMKIEAEKKMTAELLRKYEETKKMEEKIQKEYEDEEEAMKAENQLKLKMSFADAMVYDLAYDAGREAMLVPFDELLLFLDADLVKRESILLLFNLPLIRSFFSLGVDLQTSVVGPTFKVIPPGPHFVSFVSNKEANAACPITSPDRVTGFFFHSSPSEVVVRRWNEDQETFERISDCEKEAQELRISGVQEKDLVSAVRRLVFDNPLARYDVHDFMQWQELSTYITPDVIQRFEPVQRGTAISEEELDEERHTLLLQLAQRAGLNDKDFTDKSKILETALQKLYDDNEDLLLGELQFSYVAFLMGQSYESFKQWISIVTLMLSCVEAPLRTHTQLFVKFVDVLYHQLKLKSASDSVPDHGDAPWFTGNNFIRWFRTDSIFQLLLTEFMDKLKSAEPVDGELLRKREILNGLLESWESTYRDTETPLNNVKIN